MVRRTFHEKAEGLDSGPLSKNPLTSCGTLEEFPEP